MFSSKRPKFAFELTINELSNIPQINGSCFLELSIRDTKRTNNKLVEKLPGHRHHHIQQLKRTESRSKANSTSSTAGASTTTINSNSNSNATGTGTGTGSGTTTTSNSSSISLAKPTAKNSASASSNHISATTSPKRIHNFKCVFNYKLSCNLKFPLKKNENLIGNKYLLLRIYYVTEKSHSHKDESNDNSHNNHETILDLGKVDINLSEYLNFNDTAITSKYLLKESKVNSILSLTISLTELPTDYDFHTQLQINDGSAVKGSTITNKTTNIKNDKPSKTSTATSTSNNGTTISNSGFIVPQFERKNVFGGINNVFYNDRSSPTGSHSNLSSTNISSEDESPTTSAHSHTSNPHSSNSGTFLKHKLKRNNSSKKSGNSASNSNGNLNNSSGTNAVSSMSHSNQSSSKSNNDALNQKSSIIMDPLINGLYSKILENTWDPELSNLLDYGPEKCVNDIFDDPANPLGNNPKLIEKAKHINDEFDDEFDESGFRELNGLINEIKFRDDLKSWNIKVES
ncbi:N-terminal C2 in EEIG1 and EHBP1 proteins-domain-containing protein [Scheffersomyces amazonensis]|uniref:N-terminal C2 in EEIG1 and EHBP1 proteins-domain-containing protein n=1 Tax=Scheffersomyces amazonensis TaxID=1078765 RepID=UPI00315DAC77